MHVHVYCNPHITILQCCGKEISWSQLVALYERNRSEAGLSLIPKLKFEHVYLTTFSKMRVDLAAQVYTFVHVHVHVEYIKLYMYMYLSFL